jgi:UDP-N-acetylmuramoyl-L-alanyl-D-glutamate--2,6-diaminopimelate ligase
MAPTARLSELLRGAKLTPLAPIEADPEISGVALDSRRIEPGDLFFAIQGYREDGERFVPQALERGALGVVATSRRPEWVETGVAWLQVPDTREAAALLSRECHGRPDEGLTLVGITGTNGKTTVAYLLESIARAGGRKAGRIGTVGMAFGTTVESSVHTTPEAPDLYRALARMRDDHVDFVAMEVSSHALALKRVDGARFSAATFLNLSRDHLDFHETEEAYFDAKARLFRGLGPEQSAVLPADCDWAKRLSAETDARIVTFGRTSEANIELRNERTTADRSSAVLATPVGEIPVQTRLAGRFNLLNIAASVACALVAGLPAEAAAQGIAELERVPGRMERVSRGQPFTVLVDYAHTEDALRNVLRASRELTSSKLIVLFGCGGDRDRGKREGMGRLAAELADRIVLTSDNPRAEDPETILRAIGKGVASVEGGLERTTSLVDREEAIEVALRSAGPGDVVLLAGKGHETTLTAGDRVLRFDDREVAARALSTLGWKGGAGARA